MISLLKVAIKKSVLHTVHYFDELKRVKLNQRQCNLAPELWDLSAVDGHLMVQGECDAVNLARAYGTPLHVVDRQRLHKNYSSFRDSFGALYPHVEVAYSYKTNPLPGVLKTLHEFGASAEVISHFELWLALKLKVAPEKIIFNGPAKTRDALELAVGHDIKLINIDNLGEIDAIEAIARHHGRTQQVGIRVVASVGWSGQFGLSIRSGAAFSAFEKLKTCAHLKPCGLHIHLGTGIKEIGVYLRAIKDVLEFAARLKRDLGVRIRYFDFGGGFGVPTVRSYSQLDTKLILNHFPPQVMNAQTHPPLSNYASSIVELITQYYKRDDAPTIIFEPGRAITSSAQFLLLKVIAMKQDHRGVATAIVDGGKNLALPTGYEYHEVFVASKMAQPCDFQYNVYGPLCHPAELLFPLKRLPSLEIGDIIAVMDAGAYFVPNQMNFSNPRAAAVMVENGRSLLIRARESFENVVALDEWASEPAAELKRA